MKHGFTNYISSCERWLFYCDLLNCEPLKLSINALQISVDRLASAMERVQDEVGVNNEELARGEEKIKTLFANDAALNARVRHIEERCENCQCRE